MRQYQLVFRQSSLKAPQQSKHFRINFTHLYTITFLNTCDNLNRPLQRSNRSVYNTQLLHFAALPLANDIAAHHAAFVFKNSP